MAARIFATDNNDVLPGAYYLSNTVNLAAVDVVQFYQTLSNELSTPQILYCPEDKRRTPATSFTNLTSKNISFFASLTAQESGPQQFLFGDRNLLTNGRPVLPGLLTLTTNLPLSWSKEIHNQQGYVAMADGSVQQFSSSRLKQAIIDQGIATNLLLIP